MLFEHYGFLPGEKLIVIRGRKKKIVAVIKEYPFHILMNYGAYRESINKADLYAGDAVIVRQ